MKFNCYVIGNELGVLEAQDLNGAFAAKSRLKKALPRVAAVCIYHPGDDVPAVVAAKVPSVVRVQRLKALGVKLK